MADKLRWNELPVNVRRSKRLLYNYLAFGELPEMPEKDETEEDEDGEIVHPTVNISVSVTDGDNPLGQVNVAIGEITGTTGNAGGCNLNKVPIGNATVTATKDGYEDYSSNVTITSETTSLAIELTAVGDGE